MKAIKAVIEYLEHQRKEINLEKTNRYMVSMREKNHQTKIWLYKTR